MFVAVGLASLVGLSACGGDDPTGLPDATGGVNECQASETDPSTGPGDGFDAAAAAQIERAAFAALEQFGDLPTAGTVIVTAYNNGFSFAQIVSALDTGQLSETGAINGVENPEALVRFERVAYQPGQPALLYEVDIAALPTALARAQGGFGTGSFKDEQRLFLEMIL